MSLAAARPASAVLAAPTVTVQNPAPAIRFARWDPFLNVWAYACVSDLNARTVATLTASGTTATAVVQGGHGLISGQWIDVAAIPSAYSGQFIVNVIDATTFTYTFIGFVGAPQAATNATFKVRLRADEGDVIELRDDSGTSSPFTFNTAILDTTNAPAVPAPASTPACGAGSGDRLYGVLKTSTPRFRDAVVGENVTDARRGDQAVGATSTDLANNIFPNYWDLTAEDTGGSVGVWPVTANSAAFTLDVSRWARGDLFINLSFWALKVVDKNSVFKRYLAISDYERKLTVAADGQAVQIPAPNKALFNAGDPGAATINVPGGYNDVFGNPVPTGTLGPIGLGAQDCASNWRTGEVYCTNFDDFDPGVNFVGRHPGDITDPNHGHLPYSDLSRRLSTRLSWTLEGSTGMPMDQAPESVAFDNDPTQPTSLSGMASIMYVGHFGTHWPADSGRPIEPDGTRGVHEDGTFFNEQGSPVTPDRRAGRLDDTQLAGDGIHLLAGPNGMPASYWFDPTTNGWLFDANQQRVPYPQPMGKSVHRYIDVGGKWVLDASFHGFSNNPAGLGWVAVGGDHLIYATSQYSSIHRLDVAPDGQGSRGAQLTTGVWVDGATYPMLAGRNLPDVGGSANLDGAGNYWEAVRLMPPGDGSGGFLVAIASNGGPEANRILRLDAAGVPVQQYVILNDPDAEGGAGGRITNWYALSMDPSGRTFWAASHDSGILYQFDVASGRVLQTHRAVQVLDPVTGVYNGAIQGISVMWEYVAAKEVCGDLIDNDGNGLIDENCTLIPMCLSEASQNDPNCGVPVAQDDFYTTDPDTPLTVDADQGDAVLGNDTTADGVQAPVIVSVTTGAGTTPVTAQGPAQGVATTHGTIVSLSADGTLGYQPASGFSGQDSFQYTIRDAAGRTASAFVHIAIGTASAHAIDDAYTTPKNTTLVVPVSGVLGNDNLTSPAVSAVFTLLNQATNNGVVFVTNTAYGGTITVALDGSFQYVPPSGFLGQDYFFYRATDGGIDVGQATVTIDIVNRAPVATDNAYTTPANTTLNLRYAPCTGVDNDGRILPLDVFGNDCVPNQSVNVNSGLLQQGVPDSDPDGDAISILRWGLGLPASLGIDFGDTHQEWRNTPEDGGMMACASLSAGTNGAECRTAMGGNIQVWSDGRFRYMPPVNFVGTDYIHYRISDGTALSEWAKVTFTVQPKLDIVAQPQARPYGQAGTVANSVLYFDFEDGNGNYTGIRRAIARPEGMVGSITCVALDGQNPISAGTPVGKYPITCSGETRPDYWVGYTAGTFTITPVPLTVKAHDKNKTYNGHPYTDEQPFTVEYAGFVNNEDESVLPGALTFSGLAVSAVNAAPVPYGIFPGGYIANPPNAASPTNYWPITYESGGLTIGRASLSVRADDKVKTYDGYPFNGGYTTSAANYVGLVNGETPAVLSGTLSYSGPAVFAVNANPTTGYDILPGGLSSVNYDITYAPGKLRINKGGASIQVQDKAVDYNGNSHTTTCTVTGADGSTLTGGTLSYAPADVKNAGDYTATCTFDGDDNHNGGATGNGTVTVRKIPLRIKAKSGSKTYGNPFAVDVESYVGFIAGENAGNALSSQASCSSDGTALLAPVSGSPYATTCSGAAAQNYTITYEPGSLTLGRKNASVTPNPKGKTYGPGDPALDGSTSGFEPGDNVTAAYQRANGETVLGGPYTISATLSPAGVLDNYEIDYRTAPFTISKRALTVTPDGKAKKYGKNNPALTGTVTGLVFSDTINVTYSTTALPLSDVGDYPITAAADMAPATLSNYDLSTGSATLKVNKRQLKVTARDKSRQYGAPNPALDGDLVGDETNGDAAEALQLAIADGVMATFSTDVQQTDPPGAYINRIFADINNSNPKSVNYNVQKVHGKMTITLREVTITADVKTKVYGETDPALTYSVTSGSVLAGDSFSGSLTRAAGQNFGTYAIQQGTVALNSNYTLTYVGANLTITKAPLTVKADDKSKVYGAGLPGFTATITGFVNGEVLGTSGVTGAAGLSTTATAGSPVLAGGYPITAALGTLAANNYTFQFAPGTLTITKAVLTVTADNASKAYGAALPGFTATISGFANGETLATSGVTGSAALSTTATASSPFLAGGYPITAALGSLAANNYTFQFAPGTLTIAKAVLTVTAQNKTKVYGTANPTLTYAPITGFVNGDTEASAVTGTPSLSTTAVTSSAVNVAGYPITITQGSLSAASYTFSFVNATLTIDKALLTVTANNASKAYGAALPGFTTTISGFVNGETLATSGVTGSAALSTTATAASPFLAAGYPITAALGTLAANNYTFQFAPGTLTITKVALTVKADDQTKIYGTPLPGFTATITGFTNGDTLATSGVTGSAALSTSATAASPFLAAGYPITAAQGSLAANNYTFQFAPGTLTIAKAVLTVTAQNQTKVYGTANPTLTYAPITGFVNGDTEASAVTGTPSLSTPAVTGSAVNVAGYPITITQGSLAAMSYSFQFVNATLTINKALLTVTADNASKAYGAVLPGLTATISGFANGETLATSGVTGSASLTTTATSASPILAAGYPITAALGSLVANNYDFQFAPGTLTITKAVLTVTADNQTKEYGAALPGLTATITGFASGETLATSGVTGSASLSTTATSASPFLAAGYPIAAALGSLAASNYDFQFAPGTLTITKVVLTVTAQDKTKVYGDANPTLTYAPMSGFINGDTEASAVSGTAALATTAVTGSPVNVAGYPITITQGSLSATNYTFSFVNATLTIGKAPSTVTVAAVIVAFDGLPHTTTAVVGGIGGAAGGITQAVTWAYSGSCLVAPITVIEGTSCTATATYAGDANHFGSSGSNTITIVSAPKLTLTKTANPINYSTVGQPIVYTYKIVNSGNVSIAAPFLVTDDKLGVISCGGVPLAPGASTTCSKTHLITQADISAGYITNKATAAGGNGVVSDVAQAWVFATQGCSIGYPSGSAPALSSVVFNESEILKDIGPNFVYTGGTIRAWYADEHAMLLGIRSVSVKTSSGTTVTNYPVTPFNAGLAATNVVVGAPGMSVQSGGDLATWNSAYGGTWNSTTGYSVDKGRPYSPSLFITDITDNPSNKSGDWQQGGTPMAPHAVYGTWKSAIKLVDKTRTPWVITVTTDANPAKNDWNGIPHEPPDGFEAYENQGYSAEVQWNASALGLVPGRTYRVQVMMHDGDQNKTGGDVGQACMIITAQGSAPAPIADDDSYSTTAGTPLSVPVTEGLLLDDVDPAGGNLTAIKVTNPANGTVVVNADGSLVYTPNVGFTGTDTFTYKANNGTLDSNVAMVSITVSPVSAGNGFTTYTQGGWGSKPSGNNPGALLKSKFGAVYPGGVTIGGTLTLKFTSAEAIEGFLPEGGGSHVLNVSAVNPEKSKAGTIGGQLLALQLSVDFSNAGILKPGLGLLKVKSGKLAGYTVNAVLALANAVVGATGALPAGMSMSDLNGVLDSINKNFDNGTTNKGYLQ